VVGRRGGNFGVKNRWKKIICGHGRWDFRSYGKRASTGSSATGALVATSSL
jgi:hypothetical protein